MDIDLLPCGCIVTDADRKILRINRYYGTHFDPGRGDMDGVPIERLLSRASQIFSESYLIPTVMKEDVCREAQISLVSADGTPIHVIANVSQSPEGGLIWAFIEAENRNKLYHELESAREALVEQREQLEELSRTDPLTGIQNRRSFDEDLTRIFAEADRTGAPVSVLIMDIDHFKSVNDTGGHAAGDAALVQLAHALRSVCRNTDTVARLGGDEFCCLLNHTTRDEAMMLCERIHSAVDGILVDDRPITISIGLAVRTKARSINSVEIMTEADKALYRAKESGRNTTAIWQPSRSVGYTRQKIPLPPPPSGIETRSQQTL